MTQGYEFSGAMYEPEEDYDRLSGQIGLESTLTEYLDKVTEVLRECRLAIVIGALGNMDDLDSESLEPDSRDSEGRIVYWDADAVEVDN